MGTEHDLIDTAFERPFERHNHPAGGWIAVLPFADDEKSPQASVDRERGIVVLNIQELARTPGLQGGVVMETGPLLEIHDQQRDVLVPWNNGDMVWYGSGNAIRLGAYDYLAVPGVICWRESPMRAHRESM